MSSDASSPLSNVSPFRAGLATMLVGAVLAVVGLVQTTSATVQPSCPPGTVLVAKFEYSKGGYKFEKPQGNSSVVTISQANASGGKWSSTQPISAIVVKGGPGSKIVNLTPPQTSGTFSNQGLKTGGRGHKTPDISNIQFCGPKGGGTTTTVEETTTTAEETTTTVEETTTTVDEETTTTVDEETTTTVDEETTTTVDEETTTTVDEETTTTVDEETTTTVDEETTTTVDEETTTTVDEETTTTVDEETTTTVEDEDDGEVQGKVIVNTTITPDDSARVLASGQSLPRTGAPSVPLVVIGIVLLALGATLSIVNRKRGAES